MKSRIVLALFLCAAFGFTQAQAGSWRLGGGLQTVDFDDDLDLVDPALGIIFSGSYQQGSISLDLQAGSSVHDEDLADELASYGYAMVGARFSLGSGSVQPYITAGLSLHSIAFDEFDTITGEGVYWGVGADFLISTNHAINLSYRVSDWDGEDDDFDYDISNSYLGVAYNFRFSQ